MHPLSTGIVGELPCKLGRQTKCVFGPHLLSSWAEAIAGIHRRLASDIRPLLSQGHCTLDLIIRLFVSKIEFGLRWTGFCYDFLMLGKLRLPPKAAIGWIIAKFRQSGVELSVWLQRYPR